MHYSASRVKQDYGATGILYDLGSVYEGLSRITDKRKARGKLYRLETIMMIIILAKLSGEDKPSGIAEWGKHHGEELVELMRLKKSQMPSLNTYRRMLSEVACQEEVERMVGKYNQEGAHGEPIPSKDGILPKVVDMPLLDVPSGSDCVVSRVRTHDMEKLHYIGELGLVPGTPFHLLSCAPFKGPLRLQMKPQDHVIGYELAGSLWVEVKKRGEGNKLPPRKNV